MLKRLDNILRINDYEAAITSFPILVEALWLKKLFQIPMVVKD